MYFYFIEQIIPVIFRISHWKKAEEQEKLNKREKYGKSVFEKSGYSEPVYDKEKILKSIHYIQKVLVIECNLMESVLKDVYGVENPEYASIFKGK